MPIWTLASVTTEPEVVLSQWRIFETAEATRHFVGADARDSTGRGSSEVVTFDRLTLRGQTQSGRVYQLIDPVGRCGICLEVLVRGERRGIVRQRHQAATG